MDTDKKFVVTISREVGSGGRTIGRRIAERLGVRYCDKDLVEGLIEQFHLSAPQIETIKARRRNWLRDMLSEVNLPTHPGAYTTRSPYDLQKYNTTADELFVCEKEILSSLAAEGSCVIAGRSGFFVFKDHPNRLNIFIRASEEYRIRRIMDRQDLDRVQAGELVRRLDEGRENFVKRISGTSRYDCRNYDLVFKVDETGEDAVVDFVCGIFGA